MKISWSLQASDDLKNLHGYITQDAPFYARRFVARLVRAIETLPDHPRMGRRVPEAERDDVRELIFHSYRIIYLLRADDLYILAIVHGARDLSRQRPKPWEIV